MAVASKPLFRHDLLAEAIDDGGIKFVDVMDDATGVAYRFFESEYAIACGMDGARDVNALVMWSDQELGLRPTPGEVQRVVSKLAELGYLDDGARASRGAQTPDDIITAPIALQPGAENPHEVITTPTDRIDPAELGPSKPVSTNVVARSAEIPAAKSDGALARVAIASVPAAKAVIPGKRDEKPPSSPKIRTDDSTTIVSEDELAPGVITAGAVSSPKIPVENVELGHVDRTSAPAAAAGPSASGLELELGHSGPAASSPHIARAKVDDVQLGNAGASSTSKPQVSDVSIALSDHVEIDKGSVRDAVRASQVMKAVDADELERIEREAAPPPAAAKQPELKVVAKPATPPAEDKAAAKAEAKVAAKRDIEPVPATEAPDVPSSGGGALKWVAALVFAAAAAFLVYNFALKKKNEGPSNAAQQQAPVDDKAAADKAAAEKLAAEQAAKAEADKLAAEKAAAEKAAAEKAAAEQAAAAGSANAGSAAAGSADQAAADKAAADKAAADKAAADKAAADKAAAEKEAADKAAADKAAADKAAAEQAAADKAAADKAAADKAAADKAAAGNAAADKAAAEREAAKKAARAKARAEAAAREKLEMEKLLEKQRKAIEERKKQQGGTAPAP